MEQRKSTKGEMRLLCLTSYSSGENQASFVTLIREQIENNLENNKSHQDTQILKKCKGYAFKEKSDHIRN